MRRIARHTLSTLVAALCVCVAVLWPRSYRSADVVVSGGATGEVIGAGSYRGRLVFFASELSAYPTMQLSMSRISAPAEEMTPEFNAAFDPGMTLKVSLAGFAIGRGNIDVFETPPKFTAFTVPHWFALLATGVPSTIWMRGIVRRWRWGRQGRCRACGYELRSSPDRCPECGASAPHRASRVLAVAAALAAVMLAPAPARAAEPPPEPVADQRLKEVNLNPATLEDAFEVLRDLTHANIVVRWPALEKVGIERKRPVELRLWDVRLGVVLDGLLDNRQRRHGADILGRGGRHHHRLDRGGHRAVVPADGVRRPRLDRDDRVTASGRREGGGSRSAHGSSRPNHSPHH